MQSNQPVEITLYHFPPSLCSQKVRLALAEKGVAYTSRLVNIGPIMENYEPWYARLNPGLVVPTLAVGDTIITDSARIIREVDRRLDGPDLGADREEVGGWIALQDGLRIRELSYAPRSWLMGLLSKGSFDKRVQVLTRRRDENPELAHLYEARLADVATWRADTSSPETIAAYEQQLIDALAQVEAALSEQPFLAGEAYSLADVGWTVQLARMRFLRLDAHWGAATRAYYARMKARESFRTADVWERVKPLVMLPLIGQVIAFRLGLI